jgi:hypothetical protein
LQEFLIREFRQGTRIFYFKGLIYVNLAGFSLIWLERRLKALGFGGIPGQAQNQAISGKNFSLIYL